MQYRKMSEAELKLYYHHYTHRYSASIERGGACVRDCRSDRGALGRSNLIFHLPMAGVLLDNKGADYDIVTRMFPLPGLAKIVWEGFSEKAHILLGAGVLGDEKKNFKSHFDVTFESKEARYIYIRDTNMVPDVLLNQAMHYHLGNPKVSEIINRYNHYVFPLGLSYRDLDQPRSNSIKPRYIIDSNAHNIKMSRDNYRSFLKNQFGSLPLVERQRTQTAPKLTSYKASHYEDDLICECSFVINVSGQLLKPELSIGEAGFTDATTVATETWKDIAKEDVVIAYRSSCFSLPAEYNFVQRPEKLSLAEEDRLLMLAKKLQKQRYEKAKKAEMLDLLNTTSDENAWR